MYKIDEILKNIKIPRMILVKQNFSANSVSHIPEKIKNELSRNEILSRIKPGMTIAICCGSRGIADISVVVRELVSWLKERGAYPEIIPAMGSHGGASAEGQKAVLAGLGITEVTCGCPVVSSMDVIVSAVTPEGENVYMDRNAANADGIILVNRIKPHTDFMNCYESGLVKMAAIGLGKRAQAELCHKMGPDFLSERIEKFGKINLQNPKVLFGIGIIENAYIQICDIKALTPEEILIKEPKMLQEAYAVMAKVYFQNIDVLIVDQIGKEISGAGADPNITGRFATNCIKPGTLKASKIIFLDLTDHTNGNACGIGLCDITTQRLFKKIDLEMTYTNSMTTTLLGGAKIPMMMDNQRQAIKLGIYAANCRDLLNPRIVRIKNTENLNEIMISEALIPETISNPNTTCIGKPENIVFNENGDIF